MRRLLLIVDMEGVAGIEILAQITAGSVEYEAARRLLTAETNAMVAGFIQAGFDQVIISDSHESGATTTNLVVADLDKRATLETRDDAYDASLFRDVDAVACLGMHAAANTTGFVAHTVSVHCDWLQQGRRLSETDIVIALAAEAGKAVLLVSGDDVLCKDVAPPVTPLVTKFSVSPTECRSIPVSEALEKLQRAAAAAGLPETPAPPPPVPLQIRFKSRWQVVRAIEHGASRVSAYGVEFHGGTFRNKYERAMDLMGATFPPIMSALRGAAGSKEMLEDLSELIARPVPTLEQERETLVNGDVQRTLDAFLRLTDKATEFSVALRALVLHISEFWAPGAFTRLQMRPLLDRALHALAEIPTVFSPAVAPADGMSRIDAWFILAQRGLSVVAPGRDELSAYLVHLDTRGNALHAWLLGEMAAHLGMDVRLQYPDRMFRGRSRLWDLYWLTHEFFLATDYMRRPDAVETWASQLEELTFAAPWLIAAGHADLAAEVVLCMQMAGEFASARHRELLAFLRSAQQVDGVLPDASMGDPGEVMADHATGLLFLVYAGVEEWNRRLAGD